MFGVWMLVKVLASGSKGNCTYLECGNVKLLIDIGINYITLSKLLEPSNIIPKELDGVLITHIHNDHVKGLATLVKKTNIRVYVPALIARDLKKIVPDDNLIIIEDSFYIDDVEINLIHTSHDVPCSVGYLIFYNNKSLVFITDTGYINKRYFEILKNRTIYILESNHDEKMLMNGPYPYMLKQRVISDYGHLSNLTSSKYLSEWVGNETKYIVLAHLSETNNTPDMAYSAINSCFKVNNISGKNIYIAKQFEALEDIEV